MKALQEKYGKLAPAPTTLNGNGLGDTPGGQAQPVQQGGAYYGTPITTTPQTPTSFQYDAEAQEQIAKKDMFNASKMALRPTSDYFPNTKSLLKGMTLPFGVAVQPFTSCGYTVNHPFHQSCPFLTIQSP